MSLRVYLILSFIGFGWAALLYVDHDHDTGIVRGLLWHQCNWYLGTIDADPTIINRIISYREKICLAA